VSVSSEGPDGNGRYRVDARRLPFTPSWFWEVIDTHQGSIIENSLALSRTLYPSATQALAAGHHHVLGGGLRHGRGTPAKPALEAA
jgi:hypothetical protein